jgi:N-sulfoglucosamine sulfohydrolase
MSARPTRRAVLAAAAAAPVVGALACSAPDDSAAEAPRASPPRKPKPKHVLVLVADDQSRCNLGCYGNADVHTPHIDRLAASGVRFERAYTPVPICKPSRSVLYTGLYPHRNGAQGFKPIDAGVATWTELLNAAGVATGMLGKLNVKPVDKFAFESWVRPKKLGDARTPEPFAAALREMLDAFGDRRWAIAVNFKDPHRPFREPLRSDDPSAPVPHDAAKLALPPSFFDTPETRAELANYYDVTWRLDATVGALLAVLDERGIADDVLVVYTADNGMPFPFAKTTLYEAGINLPLIARWPGVAAPRVSQDFVGVHDLLPTALDVFDVASERELDGRSLLSLLRGETVAPRERFVGQFDEGRVGQPNPARSLRTERFKYIKNFAAGAEFDNNVLDFSQTWRSWIKAAKSDAALQKRMRALIVRPPEELYDLASDPWELTNLAESPEHAATLDELRAELAEWMRAERDPLAAG